MRFVLCLSYSGRPWCGWQIQNSDPTVQGTLEEALSRLCGSPVSVTGAGRTDTSVNASGYIAHFDLPSALPFPQTDFCYKLNAILPRSIVVHSVLPVNEDFHARFSARKRSYTYFIHRVKDPFVEAFSWQCGYPELDFAAMNEACKYLLGTHEFDCFEKTGGNAKTSVCTVSEAFWSPYTPSHIAVMGQAGLVEDAGTGMPRTCGHPRKSPHKSADLRGPRIPVASEGPKLAWEGSAQPTVRGIPSPGVADKPGPAEDEYWYFRISADRFLRNMVRAIVGTLMEVGRGKKSPEWVKELVEKGTRSDAGESVPGHALFLNKVEY